jgi:hypothetical protein
VAFDPTVPCRQSLANAAYPVANQMLQLTAQANLYPTTPNGRPVVGPNGSYPFGGIFAPPGLPGFGLRNTLGGIPGFPPSASPPVVVNQVAANGFTNVVPIEVTNAAGQQQVQFVTVPAPADALTAAQVVQGQFGNLFAGIDANQAVLNTRIDAATLNLAMAAYPRGQASNLRDVLEGLLAYQQLACPPPAAPSDVTNNLLSQSD